MSIILSKVAFPKKGQIKPVAQHVGYVARGATTQGKRLEGMRLEVYSENEVQTHDFGYLAGPAPTVHINSGLQHCTQVSLFDLKKQVGASSHFQVVSFSSENAKRMPTFEDFKADIIDMRETLEILGAKRNNLQGICIFGMGEYYPARSQDVIRILHSLGISIPFVYACKDADDVYRTYLGNGLISRIPHDCEDSYTLKRISPDSKDLSPIMIENIEKAEAYFKELCGNIGEDAFNNKLLPRLVALYYNRPATFLKQIKQIVRVSSNETLREMKKIFTFYKLPEAGETLEI